MPKYRKKPVVIEAVQWLGDNFVEIDEFITVPHETYPADGYLIIPTLEGKMKASLGDYIIKGLSGEFYPCKEKIFHKTYDEEGLSAEDKKDVRHILTMMRELDGMDREEAGNADL